MKQLGSAQIMFAAIEAAKKLQDPVCIPGGLAS
jgi:hypothetical protein